MMKPIWISVVALPLLAAIGCGGGEGVSVSGTVTVGGEELESGTILFVNAQDGRTARGDIREGRYRIPSGDNLTPGAYRVEISSVQETGRRVPDADNPDGFIDEVADVIPERYNRRTELTAELAAGSNTHDFALESAAPGP